MQQFGAEPWQLATANP